jgi:glutamyl-Q tRNA(Asp) synthetase
VEPADPFDGGGCLGVTGLTSYRGRFAPSPTGPLHAGSLVAALASWLDARAHRGIWLVRMEDVDAPRCVPGADQTILQQLAACGMVSDEPVVWQSRRGGLYQAALDRLVASGQAYRCGCSRKDIEAALAALGRETARHHAAVYPGICRPDQGGLKGKPERAWRFLVPQDAEVAWTDQQLGPQRQNVASEVGDFVLKRADGLWAYQLAVVVDDIEQGITHVVRGQDLADNTPRQILLRQALAVCSTQGPAPAYRHTPLVLGSNGEKLSKQNGATPLDLRDPLAQLNQAARWLNLAPATGTVADALSQWTTAWRLTAVRAPSPSAG